MSIATINQFSTEKEYKDQRWDFFRFIEEAGVPKLSPYIDDVGRATIGIGFNIEDVSNNLTLVLAAMNISTSTPMYANFFTQLQTGLIAA